MQAPAGFEVGSSPTWSARLISPEAESGNGPRFVSRTRAPTPSVRVSNLGFEDEIDPLPIHGEPLLRASPLHPQSKANSLVLGAQNGCIGHGGDVNRPDFAGGLRVAVCLIGKECYGNITDHKKLYLQRYLRGQEDGTGILCEPMGQKLPTVVIVGRPNVGKSTLFNRIVGKMVAVVEDQPGVTRDRLYSQATWRGRSFLVVDTGGILFGDEDPLIEQIRLQAEIALQEADMVIFLVDAIDGVSMGDIDLADRLRGIKSPVLVVATKADNPKRVGMTSEFYELGFEEVLPISGLHGSGVADLLDRVVELIPNVDELPDKPEEIRLAIVGRPNVGKSSMVNAFTGEQRAIVSNIPGTTRDAVDTVLDYAGETFRLIDTAGIRRRGKIQGTVEYYMALRSTRAVERADCALLVIDGDEGLTDQDKRVAKISHDMGRALVIAVNKWDLKEPPDGKPRMRSEEKREMEKVIRNEHPEVSYAHICFTSAAESAGLEPVLDAVLTAVGNWNFRISTGALNRLIQDAVFERPYTSKGRALKVYYCTQVSTRPPTFLLFVNDPDLLHFSYKRFLENRIRKMYPLPGTPIRVIARSSHKRDDE